MDTRQPPAPQDGEPRRQWCSMTGRVCLPGCDGKTACAGLHTPLNQWPDTDDTTLSDGRPDGRPDGWTETLALMFCALHAGLDACEFAEAFVHGEWSVIENEWPEFGAFVDACADRHS